jgi:hypothetical protein
MSGGRRCGLVALTAAVLLISTGTTVHVQAEFGSSGAKAHCQSAAGLNLAIGEPPQSGPSGSVDANGQLTLYCRDPATNSRDGIYSRGTNLDYVPPTVGTSCSVHIYNEPAQVLGQSFEGSEPVPGRVQAFPIAFWTGTVDAEIVPQSYKTGGGYYSDFLGGVSDLPQPSTGANWTDASLHGPAPPSDQPGSGLATGAIVMGLENQTVEISITTTTQGTWTRDTNNDFLCHGPQLSISDRVVPDGSGPLIGTPSNLLNWVPSLQTAMDSAGITAGTVVTDAPDNYLVFAPTHFWIDPQPEDSSDFAPKVVNVMGDPDTEGESIVYSYYLKVAPSDMIHWNFGDGTAEDVPASNSEQDFPVTHYYKQISGEGNVPTDGATVTASQDVVVTAFVGWVDGNGKANYECVTTGGLSGTLSNTQAQAEADVSDGGCSTTYPDALVDTPVPPKPVYQIRVVPVA